MIFKSEELIKELVFYVNSHIKYVKELRNIEESILLKKEDKKSWSIIECLEHLNLYAEFYNKEIAKRIKNSKAPKSTIFKSGYLGNKFAIDMLPKEGMKTMKTFKSKNPVYSNLNVVTIIDLFIRQQEELLILLEKAKEINLTKTKTKITLPILKFRLGDTLRFVIYHNERHIKQAQRIIFQK